MELAGPSVGLGNGPTGATLAAGYQVDGGDRGGCPADGQAADAGGLGATRALAAPSPPRPPEPVVMEASAAGVAGVQALPAAVRPLSATHPPRRTRPMGSPGVGGGVGRMSSAALGGGVGSGSGLSSVGGGFGYGDVGGGVGGGGGGSGSGSGGGGGGGGGGGVSGGGGGSSGGGPGGGGGGDSGDDNGLRREVLIFDWISIFHDQWTKATLSEFFEACRSSELGDEAFRHWLEDRAVLSGRLALAARRLAGPSGPVPPSIITVVNEDAVRLDALLTYFGPNGPGGSPTQPPVNGGPGTEHTAIPRPALFTSMAAAPVAQPASRLSYAGKRLMDLIDLTTTTTDTPACLGPIAIWALLMVTWQGWQLTRNRALHEALVAAAEAARGGRVGGRGGAGGGRRGRGRGGRGGGRGGGAAGGVAASSGLSLAAGGGGIDAGGLNPRTRALVDIFTRDDAMYSIMDLEATLNKVLSQLPESAVAEGQRAFEQIVERLDGTYEQALTVNVSAIKSICDKCGRAGHGGDRCTFQSHV